jgi:uncharacterized protein (TIGR03083 family)
MFSQSADAFLALVARIEPSMWPRPGLGMWDVRALTGHTARAILTTEQYLQHDEPGAVSIPDAETYYTAVYDTLADDAAIAQRGVEAGVWLGDDPVGQISQALASARALIDAAPPNRLVSIGGMGIALHDYLRTRVFELVVHTMDLSRATGLAHTLPLHAVADAAALAAGTLVVRGHGEELLRALTGRDSLPAGLSMV